MEDEDFYIDESDFDDDAKPSKLEQALIDVLNLIIKYSNEAKDHLKFKETNEYLKTTGFAYNYFTAMFQLNELSKEENLSEDELDKYIQMIMDAVLEKDPMDIFKSPEEENDDSENDIFEGNTKKITFNRGVRQITSGESNDSDDDEVSGDDTPDF